MVDHGSKGRIFLADSTGFWLADNDLGWLVEVTGSAMRPLAPLLAQLLWIAQPGLALFGQGQATGTLAELLDSRGGLPGHPPPFHQPEPPEGR